MPLTLDGIKNAVRLLVGAGVRNGPDISREAGLPTLVEVWRAVLGDLEDEELLAAVRGWLAVSAFWPTPADLLRARPAAARLEAPPPVGPSPAALRVAQRREALGQRGTEALAAAGELEVELLRQGDFARYEALAEDIRALESQFADGQGLSGAVFAARLLALLARHEAERARAAAAAPHTAAHQGPASAAEAAPASGAGPEPRHLRLVKP